MRTSVARGVVVSCVLALAVPLGAQQPSAATRYVDPAGLTIAEVTAMGLRQEPGLREVRTAIDTARGERQQAGLRPNPSLSIERREEIGGGDNQTMIGIEWPLDLFRRDARMAVADRTVTVMERSADDRERILAADIRDHVGLVLSAVRRLDVLDSLVEASLRTVELLDARVREGATPPLERDVASVELQRLRASRELAVGQADAAAAQLKPRLGLTADAPLALRDSLEVVVRQEASTTAPPLAPAARADVLEAEAQLAAAEARIIQAQQEGKLEVGLFGSYMRMDSGFPQSAFGPSGGLEPIHGVFHNAAAGVRVSLPVFSRNQGLVAASQSRYEGAAHAVEARRLAAAAEVAAARARDAAARRALALYSADARSLARRNLDVVRETYQLGRATLFDVLNEQLRYLDFESGYTDALADAFASRTALQRATGVVR